MNLECVKEKIQIVLLNYKYVSFTTKQPFDEPISNIVRKFEIMFIIFIDQDDYHLLLQKKTLKPLKKFLNSNNASIDKNNNR